MISRAKRRRRAAPRNAEGKVAGKIAGTKRRIFREKRPFQSLQFPLVFLSINFSSPADTRHDVTYTYDANGHNTPIGGEGNDLHFLVARSLQRNGQPTRILLTPMKILLAITAVVEAATGMALAISPSFVAVLLLDSPLDTPTGLVVGRITGAALLALATTCWLARNAVQDRTALVSCHTAVFG